MSSGRITPNNREIIAAVDSVTGLAGYPTMTGRKLDTNATASLAGVAIPIAGATTAVGVAIVDGSGNQITSFGGGTQYVDGAAPPAHATAPTLVWSDGAVWQTVSTAKPLPITIAGGLSNPLPVSGTVAATQSGNWSILAITNALPAGTNLLGKISIDQTTPGTTNQVSVSQMGAAAAMADGTANPTLGGAQGYNMVYNGATWERMRGDLGDASGATGLLVNSSLLYNGATYDRQRGDTTNGAWVNVKAQVQPTAPTTIFDGKTTVVTAGSRVTLAASQAVVGVTVKALSTNTGFIYVGNASVASTNGLQLQAGESVSFDIANLNTINLDSSVSGEGVSYLAVG